MKGRDIRSFKQNVCTRSKSILTEHKGPSPDHPRTYQPNGTTIAVKLNVKETTLTMTATEPQMGVDMVDLVEEMLYQRASSGIRPALYLSSYTDLECSMLMLLDDAGEVHWSTEQQPVEREVGYHMVTN